jgi:mannose-1-phosphate guanylyltransferase
MKQPELWAVILAGGRGLRFWPRSRQARPKPTLALGTAKPLIVETVARLRGLVPPSRIFVSTAQAYARVFQKALPGIPRSQFILEPEGRDTAAGIGLAAVSIEPRMQKASADAVLAVLPADHVITRPAAFRTTLLAAARIAAVEDVFVTIGIRPTAPSPLFGYLLPGRPYPGGQGAVRLRRFQEKPEPAAAQKLIARGGLWNAGMFIFRPATLRRALRRYQPALAEGLERIAGAPARRRPKVIRAVFPHLPKISFDYAIMEKAGNVAMLPGDFGWSDVGSWDMLYRFLGGDGEKNLAAGPLAVLDSKGCYADSRKLVALVGVENLVLVETADAILVMARGQEQKLKALIARMEAGGLWKYL